MSDLANEIVTDIPASFIREFADEILGSIPAEKVRADLNQALIGRALLKEGAVAGPAGLGQKLGEVDARTWHRWNQEHPGCWSDRAFISEFFADNPRLKSAGWTAKTDKTRHGVTFIGGEAVSNLR